MKLNAVVIRIIKPSKKFFFIIFLSLIRLQKYV